VSIRPTIGLGDLIRAMNHLHLGDDVAREQVARVLGIEMRAQGKVIAQESNHSLNFEDEVRVEHIPGDVLRGLRENPKIDRQRDDEPVPPKPNSVQISGAIRLSDPVAVAPIQRHGSVKAKRLLIGKDPETSSPSWEPLFAQASQDRIVRMLARNWLPCRGGLDLGTLVDELAQLRLPTPFPMHHGFGLTASVQVLLDASYPMEPFFFEQSKLIEKIQGFCHARMEILRFAGTPLFGVRTWKGGAEQDYKCPPPGTPIVILSHFYVRKTENQASVDFNSSWLQFADMVRQRGCHPIGVIPLPLMNVPSTLLEAIPMVTWDFMTSLSEVAHARRHACVQSTTERKRQVTVREPPVENDLEILRQWRRENPEVVRLARRASWLSHIEPRVLGHLRTHIMPVLNVQAEWDLLHSPLIRHVDFRGASLKHEVRNQLLIELLADGMWKREMSFFQKMRTQKLREKEYMTTLDLEEELLYHGSRPSSDNDSPETDVERVLNELSDSLLKSDDDLESVAYWIINVFPGLPGRVKSNTLYWALLRSASLLFPYRRTKTTPPDWMHADIQKKISDISSRFLKNVEVIRRDIGIQKMEDRKGVLLSCPPAEGAEYLFKIPFSPPVPPLVPGPIAWPLEIRWVDVQQQSYSEQITFISAETVSLMSGTADLLFHTALGEESYLHWNGMEHRVLVLTCYTPGATPNPNLDDWRSVLSREVETSPGQRVYPKLVEVDISTISVVDLQEMALQYDHILADLSKPNATIVYVLAGLIELGRTFTLLTDSKEIVPGHDLASLLKLDLPIPLFIEQDGDLPVFLNKVPKVTRNTLLAYRDGHISKDKYRPLRDSLLGLNKKNGTQADTASFQLLKDFGSSLRRGASRWDSERRIFHLSANFGKDGDIMSLPRHQWLKQILWPTNLEDLLTGLGLPRDVASQLVEEQKDSLSLKPLLDAFQSNSGHSREEWKKMLETLSWINSFLRQMETHLRKTSSQLDSGDSSEVDSIVFYSHPLPDGRMSITWTLPPN